MRIHADNLPIHDLSLWKIMVDGVLQRFVIWFDTKEKVAECAMSDKDNRSLYDSEDLITYTIHRFDVYYMDQLVESVQ